MREGLDGLKQRSVHANLSTSIIRSQAILPSRFEGWNCSCLGCLGTEAPNNASRTATCGEVGKEPTAVADALSIDGQHRKSHQLGLRESWQPASEYEIRFVGFCSSWYSNFFVPTGTVGMVVGMGRGVEMKIVQYQGVMCDVRVLFWHQISAPVQSRLKRSTRWKLTPSGSSLRATTQPDSTQPRRIHLPKDSRVPGAPGS